MRPDQLKQLQDLSERLADVFLVEADPDNWSGGGKLPCDMDKQERGDRHWDRKGALGTGAVLTHTLNLINHYDAPGRGTREDPGAEGELDKAITDAEKRASAALARVMNKAKGKDEFDRRAHGKPA